MLQEGKTGGISIWVSRVDRMIGAGFFWIILGCTLVGAIWQRTFAQYVSIVPYLIAIMTFSGTVGCRIENFRQVGRKPGAFIGTFLSFYLVMPLLAFVISRLFYPTNPELWAGHVLLAALPSATSSSLWVRLSSGNVPLGIGLLTFTAILGSFAVPGIMGLVAGHVIPFSPRSLLLTLTKIVLIPVILAMLFTHKGNRYVSIARPFLSLIMKLSVMLVVVSNAAANAPFLAQYSRVTFLVLLVILLQTIMGYVIAYFAARTALRLSPDDAKAFLFVNAMRNDGAGIAIALAYFTPLVAIPSGVSIMIQQPFASLVLRALGMKRGVLSASKKEKIMSAGAAQISDGMGTRHVQGRR